MSSAILTTSHYGLTWDSLPADIQLLIFKILRQDGSTLASLATVSREWQREFERHNFARIRLTPSRLGDFGPMVHRNRALIGYIWFCLELDNYDCSKCNSDQDGESLPVTDTDYCPITTSFQDLFMTLSTWNHEGDLVLDISIYSLSDSEHWYKYLTFMPDTLGDADIEQLTINEVFHDPQHGWIDGFRDTAPRPIAEGKVFHSIMEEGPFDSQKAEIQWWDQLPSVPVVTSLLLRQQNRRRWKPDSLAHMFARLPMLQEVHYEPWREWDFMEKQTDRGKSCYYQYLFDSIRRLNKNLKSLAVFENFNQQYPFNRQVLVFGREAILCDDFRIPNPAVSRAIALASLNLEHLAASFIADASQFFEIESSLEWPNLRSLVLTSKILMPNESSVEIGAILQTAAVAAIKMPQLEIMEIWNGRKGLAALFKYRAFRNIKEATITWRGTWKLTIEPSTIQAWKAVVHRYDGWRFKFVEDWLDEAAIRSHGDAIHHLMLSSEVIRPISLQQIQREQKALEGVPTVPY